MSDSQQNLSRRRVIAGAGTAGTLAVAGAMLPASKSPALGETVKAVPTVPPGAAGYRETEHVLRYYRTTLV